ncbi:s-adenosyl-l-methionine-dependent methyltransferase [Trichoderma arundinaceum]|uniref:S-adenosyl-l-methionine-dependent methyltransferase n=1 Tax=Trichoderma arundinaceum TaxID=490622 RepID=A0A395NXE0_TRIAR|nr:s-adenosyl-l-methionine-dependent methyltransferase [Trichoderma arundinaceum]
MSDLKSAQNGENLLEIFDLDSGRKLLREYSGIPDEDVNSHIEVIKEKALQVRPYPCIRRYRFLDLIMITTDVYEEVLERVKDGEKFMDLGCCFGQEIRKLVQDGAPSINTYGSDLWGEFLSIGYELFKDKDRLQTTFIAADIFDDSSSLTRLSGQMNIIYVGDFFHLFNLEEQEGIAIRVAQLLVSQPGALIIGRQSGGEIAGEYSRVGDTSGRRHFQHNPQSWKELWERVGEKTGSRWMMEADLCPEFKFKSSVREGKSSEVQRLMDAKGLRFTIRRLE